MSSDDNTTFETGTPPTEYVPMGDAYAAPPEKEKEYSSDSDGLTEAAKDVSEQRAAREPELVERTYVTLGDPDHPDYGKPRPANETITIERAADDLTRIRDQEQQGLEAIENAATAIQTDAERLGVTPEQLLEQQYGQQQAQPEIQPQPVSDLPPEVAELHAELERSPRLKAALTEEAHKIQAAQQAAEQTQQQYAAATNQAYAFAIQSMVAAVPELQGISVDQLPAALQVLQQSNPQRHAAAVQHLARVDQLGKAAAAAQQQQQQRQQQQVAQWAQVQDAEVDAYLAKNEAPETVRAVKDNLGKILGHYGVDANEFRQAITQTPILRSAPFQKMLFSLGKQFVLQEQVEQKRHVPLPQVQRPGVSQPKTSYADGEVAAARERFLKNPDDLRVAAAYLQAKRNARS